MAVRPIKTLSAFIIMLYFVFPPVPTAWSGERIGGFSGNPPLLSSRSLPTPPQIDHDVIAKDAKESTEASEEPDAADSREAKRRGRRAFRRMDASEETESRRGLNTPMPSPIAENGTDEEVGQTAIFESAPEPPPREPEPLPTPEGVETYRRKLEHRLHERFDNQPDYAGKIGRVTVILARPLEYSMDGRFIRAEFDVIVQDIWGERLAALEKEYFVVTFGSGGAEAVRSDPSVRVGLDLEKTYSERAPLAADPFRRIEEAEAFRKTPTVTMPEWWRPNNRDDER